METKIRLGVSSCLLGLPVRYDGGHQLAPFLVEGIGPHVEWVPVCPEAECGFGVPREPMRLEGDPQRPRLVTVETRVDQTARMLAWARRRVAELEGENLCGFIFKANSPSCGIERVEVCAEAGAAAERGVGLFARIFMEHFARLPVEDEARLRDPRAREDFTARVLALKS